MVNNEYIEQLNKNGVISFVPSGNSMWPFVKNKKQSVIIEKKTDRLSLYDVGFYLRDNGNPVLHRVVKVLNDGYVMKGDSQYYTENIKEDAVFGKMTGIYVKKKFLDCNDKKLKKKVERWCKSKILRKLFCDFYFRSLTLKNKIKKLFKGNKNV